MDAKPPPPHAGNLSPGIAAASPASQPNAQIIPKPPRSRQIENLHIARQRLLRFIRGPSITESTETPRSAQVAANGRALAVCGPAPNAPERVVRLGIVLNINAQSPSLPWPSLLCPSAKRSRVHGRKTVLASFKMCCGVNYNMSLRQFYKVLTPTRMTGQ